MSERTFARPAHRAVLAMLSKLDRSFLEHARCWFGGGTRIVLELGEYRVSNDVDFLCSDRDGYRALRETVSEASLGAIARRPLPLAREVRVDQFGIRTFVGTAATKVKLELIREARIDLAGQAVVGIPVVCLCRAHCFAEKLLANADRGLDDATLSRELVDLAFMIEGWSKADAEKGMVLAKDAYGASVARLLGQAREKMRDKLHRARCVEALGLDDTKTMSAGLRALARLC